MSHNEKIRAKRYEKLNKKTGEIEKRVTIDYDGSVYRASLINKDTGIPKKTKAKEPFLRINKNMDTLDLSIDEQGFFFFLSRLVEWENNFIQNESGYLTITEVTKLSKKSRPTVLKYLEKLEEKGIVTILLYNKVKLIYLSSKYVWFGDEKNRNDSKLQEFKNSNLPHPTLCAHPEGVE